MVPEAQSVIVAGQVRKEALFAGAYSGVDFPSAGFIPRSLWARFARQDAAEQGDLYSVIGL